MLIKGRFFDGKKATAHQAVIYLELTSLRIESSSLDRPLRWHYREIRITHRPDAGQPIIIQHSTEEDARIMIEDTSVYDEISKRIPRKNLPLVSIAASGKSLLTWVVPSIAVLFFIYWSAPLIAVKLAKHFPQSWEESLGEYAVRSMTRDKLTCHTKAGSTALDHITHRLADTLTEKPKLRVKVVKEKTANAFAAPGGHIVIFSGLIDQAETPDEVAGVIAHEMGHVIKDHSTQTLVRALGLQLVLTATFGGTGDASTGVMIANELLQLQHSRAFEREADMIAAQILRDANIDNAGMIRFFDRMNREEAGVVDRMSSYVSTHPSNEERVSNLKQMEKATNAKPVLNKQQWLDLKAICDAQAP